MVLNILLVEDDPMVAIMFEGYVEALGHKIVAAAENVRDAIARCNDGGLDLAILDIHLANGETSEAVAEALNARRIPFLVTTGDATIVSDPAFAGMPILRKPLTLAELELGIASLT